MRACRDEYSLHRGVDAFVSLCTDCLERVDVFPWELCSGFGIITVCISFKANVRTMTYLPNVLIYITPKLFCCTCIKIRQYDGTRVALILDFYKLLEQSLLPHLKSCQLVNE